MWVSADDCTLWRELIGAKTPRPAAPGDGEDDAVTFAEQEIDRACQAGEEGRFGSDGRACPGSRPADRFTLPRLPVQRSRGMRRITVVERTAALAALWNVCRLVLNGLAGN